MSGEPQAAVLSRQGAEGDSPDPAMVPSPGGPGRPGRRSSPRKPNGQVMLTRTQVAELCGFVNPHATDRLVREHADFPRPHFPFKKSPRWLRTAVEAWIRKHHRAAQVQEVQLP